MGGGILGEFSEDYLQGKIDEYTYLLGESGAMMRDAERWGSYMTYPDGYELQTFADMRWPQIDEAMEMIMAAEGKVDFLEKSNYSQKAGDIHAGMQDEYAQYYEAVYAEAYGCEEEYEESGE